MDQPCVLEWIRHQDGVWNLPRAQVARLRAEFPGVRFVAPADRAEADALLPGADIVLGFAVGQENFASATRLKWIHATAAGITGMLFPALVASDVTLTCSRGLYADAMAEHTLGVMLAFARQLHLARASQRERRWTQVEQVEAAPGFAMLGGATLGIVGFGHIGREIGRRARALGMHVLGLRRHPTVDPEPAHELWGPGRLHELLERSDWIVLAAPQTRESTGMIGAAELARIRPGAYLVNVGRGALVDEPALIEALRAGRLAGAALDVFTQEPLPAESPLWTLPQVILTPHVSGLRPDHWERATTMFAANLRAYLAGEPLHGVVDKVAGY
jgi:phosphoglycerate dehydrogenase-like enzyme